MLLKWVASLVVVVLLALTEADGRVVDRPNERGLMVKARAVLPWRKSKEGPVARALNGLVSETGLISRMLQADTALSPRSFDVATPRRVTKDWLINEIFDGVVSYIKWNILNRISETLIEDFLVEVLDPKLRDLLPRDIAHRILNVLFKKFQFFFMFLLNSMFANF